MARTIHYTISDNGSNVITDLEWEAISRLQHWYNSEFFWTAGRLACKMYEVFPNWEGQAGDTRSLAERIGRRRKDLRRAGLSENEIVLKMVADGIVLAKRGGYSDHCLASGFTKVAGNEFNAYLVCEFLLKSSLIATKAEFCVIDQGKFIKCGEVRFLAGHARVIQPSERLADRGRMVGEQGVFSIVNPEKYSAFPQFRSFVSEFNDLEEEERTRILHDWNWLGFGDNFDLNGDDIQGYDLNSKVLGFEVIHE